MNLFPWKSFQNLLSKFHNALLVLRYSTRRSHACVNLVFRVIHRFSKHARPLGVVLATDAITWRHTNRLNLIRSLLVSRRVWRLSAWKADWRASCWVALYTMFPSRLRLIYFLAWKEVARVGLSVRRGKDLSKVTESRGGRRRRHFGGVWQILCVFRCCKSCLTPSMWDLSMCDWAHVQFS